MSTLVQVASHQWIMTGQRPHQLSSSISRFVLVRSVAWAGSHSLRLIGIDQRLRCRDCNHRRGCLEAEPKVMKQSFVSGMI